MRSSFPDIPVSPLGFGTTFTGATDAGVLLSQTGTPASKRALDVNSNSYDLEDLAIQDRRSDLPNGKSGQNQQTRSRSKSINYLSYM